jgi:hypothetical protein
MSDKKWDGETWWDDRSLAQKIGLGFGLALLAVGLFFLYGWLVMSLWNWLMPALFRLPTMDFWQAIGLPLLIMLLFMGVGSNNGEKHKDRKRKRELRRSMHADKQATQEDDLR